MKAYEVRDEDSSHHILLIQSWNPKFSTLELYNFPITQSNSPSPLNFPSSFRTLPHFKTNVRSLQRYCSVVGQFSLVLMSLIAELFEGDIIMDQRLRSWVTGQYDKRDAINDVSYLWPASLDENGKRVIRVPYTLSDEIKRGNKRSSIFFSCVFSLVFPT